MQFRIRSRTGFVLGGSVAALIAGAAIALALKSGHRGETTPPPPASAGGLVIEPASTRDTQIAPTRSLRCFVDGKFVGEFTLADCAKRNGVATDALDVGVDATGALGAAAPGGPVLTPLPPPETAAVARPKTEVGGPLGVCWRYDGGWRKLPNDLTLAACAQNLFANRCEKPGGASYGRWAQQTLRLVAGRVEISNDNRNFRTLSQQGPGCSLPMAG